MNFKIKKTLVIFLCFTFLFSAVGSSIGVKINKNLEIKEEKTPKIKQLEEVTFLRYGPEGDVSSIVVEIDYENEENLFEILKNKCNELIENDVEMQDFFDILNSNNESNITIGYKDNIISWGRGFHFKSKILFKAFIMKRLFSLLLPYIRIRITRPWIFCQYKNDSKAKTIINPLSNNSKVINGSHSILIRNFIGIACWTGRFDKSNIDIVPRMLFGRAKFYICNKL